MPCLKKFLSCSPAFVFSDGLCGLPEEKEEIEDVLCSDVEQKVESIRKEENRLTEHGCRLKAAQQDNLIGFEPEEDKGIQINKLKKTTSDFTLTLYSFVWYYVLSYKSWNNGRK